MKVKELIRKLEKMPPSATVLFYDDSHNRRADRVEPGILKRIGSLRWWVEFQPVDKPPSKKALDPDQEVAVLIR